MADDVNISRAYLAGLRQHLESHERIGEIVTQLLDIESKLRYWHSSLGALLEKKPE